MKIGSDSTLSHEPDSLPFIMDQETLPSHRHQALYLPPEQLSTPEVQKVVVEHVIKNCDLSSHYHGPGKLRPFSGKIPSPHSESDYDTWRNNVEFHLTDATLSDRLIVRRIVESLLPPATNVVKYLGHTTIPKNRRKIISAYLTQHMVLWMMVMSFEHQSKIFEHQSYYR